MLLSLQFLLCSLLLRGVFGEDTTTDTTVTTDSTDATTPTSSTTSGAYIVVESETVVAIPTGDYLSYTTTSTVSPEDGGTTPTPSASDTATTTEVVVTGTGSVNGTATTSSGAANTQACNGYTEFCERKYSNITMVTAHNSPFAKKNNIASNQNYDVTTQLNDGVRMLSFEAHYYKDDIYLCHSSCSLLNMGTLESYLTTVTNWMEDNPFEVVTILIVNSDYVSPSNFTSAIENSGLKDYAYEPWKVPMSRDDWPTLSNMIVNGKRAVVFMDYQADQSDIPYILDEFTQMWETPFSPLNTSFPCTRERPPGISDAQADERMYMINHNLNVEIVLDSVDILIPNSVKINVTNAYSGYGSLGLMANNCLAQWDRAPNFLLVDYYDQGSSPGSVFQVAAEMNNVTYNGDCCGTSTSFAGRVVDRLSGIALYGVSIMTVFTLYIF
ncbi:hypothetical protein ASPWEDRAFT_41090 [Aspergillus wentii DTO 134E9]|uniref:Phosphatidylinositol-specific phospholipase C X domain-containing protein n=1 Tax=Aspergillus wentii DTO 134E9 TaxID=1073089 RepID=A0A1L9RLN3_ASPWE|nr:uncharacterized protein ASPWEDRAFT_41090 [Aspergillus wentii DTO 134E9]OJJ35855.1 hypothetical protein ASPWEDRAFT_41090 [Aspergillus wentii DTO 134E9]